MPYRCAGSPQLLVQVQRVLDRDVQLVAELAEVGDAQREHRRVPEVQLPRAHVGKVGIGERRIGELREHVARARPAQIEHGPRGRLVVDRDAAVVRQVALQRRAVAHAQRAARDEVEPVGREPRDRDVGLDAAALVAQLRVDDGAGRPIQIVRREVLQQRERAGTAHLVLGERAHVDQGDTLAHRAVLGADRVERRAALERRRVDRRRSRRREPVRPLPAELVAVDGAGGLQRGVQRAAPRVASGVRLVRRPRDVIVAAVALRPPART